MRFSIDLQLDLLPYAYYNTLGFDPELVDYVDHIDDSFLDLLVGPLYDKRGRRPASPIAYFRMHYLYFTRPEITSFRQLCKQLRDPKNQAWRSFIGVPNPAKVPSHQSLSDFRNKVGPDVFEQIRDEFIRQSIHMEGFIQDTLAAIDSRPIYANVNGYKKKRCDCEVKSVCTCEKTFSDPDATYGAQRSKVNQNRFFVGYRKHSIAVRTSQGPVALLSILKPANVGDIRVMLPLIEKLRQINEMRTQYLVADMGYIDADDQKEAYHKHSMAVVTGFRSGMVMPEECNEHGQPECEQGERLIWDGFDWKTATSWFRGDSEKCQSCPLSGVCSRQFEFSFDDKPIAYGPVPQGTMLHAQMLDFRRQIELSFAQESNELTTVMKHKKVPVRTNKRVQSFFTMQDIFQLMQARIGHIRETMLPDDHIERITQMYTVQAEQLKLDIAA
ncbi:transposase (plasmid) [Alicyclobacillus fastidiosus]|uniref:Transposase n=2 Tax=Alicyclobacillus fastidiosus TaxID=392011 RepID=A0ABY6ZCP2_9BACL|nr:transposase [Alicyclobacillus fastidiosus]WAH40003.1 transposase [Alicyclobacillus fastidiosus]WAH40614.1 transposase [Alicyclobacillus fastidiosus]WAH40626.1 transposase [Alicyclobacillus fastidiosus]WAH40699.1 transposase [Alicyclobacillus fastidiosus]WAH41253.1 transposase [Alicyclobacillus fastidiosus]